MLTMYKGLIYKLVDFVVAALNCFLICLVQSMGMQLSVAYQNIALTDDEILIIDNFKLTAHLK